GLGIYYVNVAVVSIDRDRAWIVKPGTRCDRSNVSVAPSRISGDRAIAKVGDENFFLAGSRRCRRVRAGGTAASGDDREHRNEGGVSNRPGELERKHRG